MTRDVLQYIQKWHYGFSPQTDLDFVSRQETLDLTILSEEDGLTLLQSRVTGFLENIKALRLDDYFLDKQELRLAFVDAQITPEGVVVISAESEEFFLSEADFADVIEELEIGLKTKDYPTKMHTESRGEGVMDTEIYTISPGKECYIYRKFSYSGKKGEAVRVENIEWGIGYDADIVRTAK